MTAIDCIRISGLRVDTCIGVYDWEKTLPQTLRIDLELRYDMTAAAASDALNDAIDYAAVAARVCEHTAAAQLKLIESLAAQLAELILTEFPVQTCAVTVHKPGAVENTDDVSVTVQRPAV